MKNIGKYTISETLGEGGMGVVYKGEDALLHRTVAIKVVHQHHLSDAEIKERFLTEARLTAKLQHQNIATLYNLIENGEELAMIMEYLEGINLDDLLKNYKPLPEGVAKSICLQVLTGLQFAHDNGIVHRDIKPSNIMITKNGTVKILDFGIARMQGTSRMTQTGKMVGTLHYMAPEQIMGQETTQQTDIYATGIMLFEMLHGAPPFAGVSDYKLMQAQVKTSPNLSNLDSNKETKKIIKKALQKKSQNRFSSAIEFRDFLDQNVEVAAYSNKELAAFVFDGKEIRSGLPEINSTGSSIANQNIARRPIQREARNKIDKLPSWLPMVLFGAAGLFLIIVMISNFGGQNKVANDGEKIVASDEIIDHSNSMEIPNPTSNSNSNSKKRKENSNSIPDSNSNSNSKEENSISDSKEAKSISNFKEENKKLKVKNNSTIDKSINSSKSKEVQTTEIKNSDIIDEKQIPAAETESQNRKETIEEKKEIKTTPKRELISVRIPRNASLIISLLDNVSSETAYDNMRVRFKAQQGLKVDGIEVIERGEMVYGKIDKVRASGGRKSGRLEIELDYTTSKDGQKIDLYGIFYESGKGNSEVNHGAGKQFEVKIKTNTTVEVYQ